MEIKTKRWIVTFQTIDQKGNASTATQEVMAVSEPHAKNIFIREHDSNGMTYRILLVHEAE